MQEPDISTDVGQSASRTLDEQGRAVILLPADACYYNDPRYVAVAFDACADGLSHEVLSSSGSALPYLANYQLFSILCNERARMTVGGRLRVGGRVVRPETYLDLWRTAIAQALTPAEFAHRYGYVPYAMLGGVLDGLRGRRKSLTCSPFGTFDDLEAVHGKYFEYIEEGRRFRVALDLRVEHAARDAFYLESFLFAAGQRKESGASVVLKALDPLLPPGGLKAPAQDDLFATIREAA